MAEREALAEGAVARACRRLGVRVKATGDGKHAATSTCAAEHEQVSDSVCRAGFTALRAGVSARGPRCWRSKQGDGGRLLTGLLANMWVVMQRRFLGGGVVCGEGGISDGFA